MHSLVGHVVWVFCRIPLAVVVSFSFVSFSSLKAKLFLFSLLASGFQGVRLCLGRLFSNFYVVHGCDFPLFSSLILLRCSAWLWEEKVMFFCWMSLHLVCFQFVCVLPFPGDFRTLFRCFSDFGALFSNFYVVHGCDFTVFLWLRSLFCSLVLLRC